MSGEVATQDDVESKGDGKKKVGDQEAMYESKQQPKAIRVLTVFGYIMSVSMAAIMLSLYYVLMWNPPDPSPAFNSTRGKR